MEHLRDHGPHLRVEATQLPLADVLPALEQSRIDLALGYLPEIHGTEHEKLIDDRYVVVVRKRHPRAHTLGTRRGLERLEYVVSQSHPEPAKALVRAGMGDQVRLTVPHYSAVPDVLARTDLAAIVPQRPALHHAQHFALELAELRLDIPPLEVWAHWYWRMNDNPGHRWLRETLAALYRRGDAATVRRRTGESDARRQ
jgi:DNA-binding transcriptional LysR family regulator